MPSHAGKNNGFTSSIDSFENMPFFLRNNQRFCPLFFSFLLIFFLSPLFSLSHLQSEELFTYIEKIDAHTLIKDYPSALDLVKKGREEYPKSIELKKRYVKALAKNGREFEAIDFYEKQIEKPDSNLLEEIAWSILERGLDSSQYTIRLYALLGAYLTRDARAGKMMLRMMRDSNALLRSTALQLSADFGDLPLRKEVIRLLDEEKNWQVRLEVIKACGKMRIKSCMEDLKKIVSDDRGIYEEKMYAIEALLAAYENVDSKELTSLFHSPLAGLRQLGCAIALHLKKAEALDGISSLVSDPRSDVKIAAINALSFYYIDLLSKEEVKKILMPASVDMDANVAISALFAISLVDPDFGLLRLKKHLFSEHSKERLLAASALSHLGKRGVELSIYGIEHTSDPFVKVNLAMGLITQRASIKQATDVIYHFLEKEKSLLMWDLSSNPKFPVLTLSKIKHREMIPQYPESIDHAARLQLLSLLAIVGDERAFDAIKSFLQKRNWGITGIAATTLLQEGDSDSVDAVRKCLDEKEPNVQLQAALALAFLAKDESMKGILESFYPKVDRDKKLHILEALGYIGTGSEAFYLEAMKSPSQTLRVVAAASCIQTINH